MGMFTDLHCQVIICCGEVVSPSPAPSTHPLLSNWTTSDPAPPGLTRPLTCSVSHEQTIRASESIRAWPWQRKGESKRDDFHVGLYTLPLPSASVKRWKKSELVGLLWPVLQWLKEEVVYCSCCPEPESCYQTMVFKKSVSCWFLWC